MSEPYWELLGAVGPAGAQGAAEGWYSGAGAPSAGLGANGDWYLDTTPGSALATVESALGADVTLVTAGTYYDGPSVSLAAGTWLLIGHVTLTNSGAGVAMSAKLWDGTTVYASGEQDGVNANDAIQVGLSAIVVPASTITYKISASGSGASTGRIKAAIPNFAAGNTASKLTAVKLG